MVMYLAAIYSNKLTFCVSCLQKTNKTKEQSKTKFKKIIQNSSAAAIDKKRVLF